MANDLNTIGAEQNDAKPAANQTITMQPIQ